MQTAKNEIQIVKIGGNIVGDKKRLEAFLLHFAAIKGKKILVHGGGKLATEMAEKLNIPAQMVNGRRITDEPTLDIITMVYGGLVNKKIVAVLQQYNCNALGLSGADINCIRADKRPVTDLDYGFAGDISEVNAKQLIALLEAGISPVLCPITHDKKGQLLNTNADTIASETAIALAEHYKSVLTYCFEKAGVLENVENEDSVITHIDSSKYKQLLNNGIISEGMLPKLHNCFHALENGVDRVCIGNEKMISEQQPTFSLLTL
ncbi:acetylglutamate kinase [Leptobacterium flavescens]|uniref:Acetylglutamate kinase n=1 Tax=Leptobacterium flavescens TaxID=472055 RepID=A0A6P0UVA3_9FLAO|nr:acetylglutamate kinase [Leptobacterium flavescens]NER14743.1 acetylglutamate kinase [Leptobacterium flavescens]